MPSEPRISVACQGLILMDVGYQGLDWQVDEYSRARAATGAGRDCAEQDGRIDGSAGVGEDDGDMSPG